MSSNPLKASNFYEDDGAILEAIKQLEVLRDTYGKLLDGVKKDAKELSDTLTQVNNTTKDGQETTRKAATDAEKLKKAQDEYSKALDATNTRIRELKDARRNEIKLQKLQKKAAESQEGSYDQLSAQYALNKIRLNAMSKAERENIKVGKQLEKQTAEIYDEMKRLQEATGKHVLSVGDYEKGTRKLLGQLQGMPGATGRAAQGIEGMGAAASKFIKHPLVLVIGLLVGSLVGLFNIFKKTKAGSDLLLKANGLLQGGMSALTGIVDGLYKRLQSLFKDPQQGMKDFWNAFKTNVSNRFKGFLLLLGAVGKGLKSLWNRDLKGVKDAASEAGGALIQMNTGLDAEQQKQFANAVRETTKEVIAQAKAFSDLEAARLRVNRANRGLEKSLERLITKEEQAKAIADDNTRSFKEREEAARRASEFTIKRAKVEQQIASNRLAIINREIDLRAKNGENVEALLDQQLDLYKSLKQAERDYLLSVADNQKRESELKQDRLERDLDILIDGFDNQKTINERIIADDTRTLQERQVLLDQTKILFEDTFNKQIETIQKFTGIQLNANELIKESDAVVLNQKIRALGLSEIIEGRLLEIIRERRTASQDLADTEQQLNDERKSNNDKIIKQEREVLEQKHELRLSEIDIEKKTEAEKTRLRLKAEKDRLQAILDLNQKHGGKLSQIQIDTIKNTMKGIDQELAAGENEDRNIYSMIGLKLSDDEAQKVGESIQFILENIKGIMQARIDAADAVLDKSREEADEAQSRLDQEIENRNAGFANNVATEQKKLELAKKREQDALKEKRKAQKAQEKIDTAIQVSGLLTSSVNIWKSLSGIPIIGPALAVAAIGTMWANFAANKVRAKQAAKEKFGDGGFGVVQGGSHASGNDVNTGIKTSNGREAVVEGGEMFAVINKRQTKKYKAMLPGIINSLNKGTFENTYGNAFIPTEQMPMIVSGYDSIDLKKTEGYLEEIRDQGEQKQYRDENGNLVVKYKNITRTYV